MTYLLDKIDKRILFELDKNARIPETTLAKIVGRSKESVRYRIKKLQEGGVTQGFTIWIDPTKLGFFTAKMYLTLANIPVKRKEFVEFVTKDKRLFWLGIAEGAWNAGLTYFVRSNREFFELKNELFSKFKDLILEGHTGMVVEIAIYDKVFWYNKESRITTLFGTPENYTLEALEKNILNELFFNARVNVVDIARKYNISVDIVRNRIKRLEEKKIITRYLVKVDFKTVGYNFYKTFLYFKNLIVADELRLMEYCRIHPNIVHVVKQISPWDIELEILCESYNQYNTIISQLTEEFSTTINKVETAIMSEDYVFPSQKMVFE